MGGLRELLERLRSDLRHVRRAIELEQERSQRKLLELRTQRDELTGAIDEIQAFLDTRRGT